MSTPPKFSLSVDVKIQNGQFASGGVMIREEVPLRDLTFAEMAQILEAFHTLIEKFRET